MEEGVRPVSYWPPDRGYQLAVEVIGASELRERVAAVKRPGYERVDFQCLLVVVSGHYEHVVDFERYECTAGSCLLVGPGQVHRFGPHSDWSGWMVVMRAEHMPPGLADLGTHVDAGPQLPAVTQMLERMEADTRSPEGGRRATDLLALQARVLLERLALRQASTTEEPSVADDTMQRFRVYRAVVEARFRELHQVSEYARIVGCSTRTLNRASRAATGMTAKQVIVQRIILEARRLLTQMELSVAAIGAELGFGEATNFVKFFRRESGETPTAFRASTR